MAALVIAQGNRWHLMKISSATVEVLAHSRLKQNSITVSSLKTQDSALTMAALVIAQGNRWHLMKISSATVEVLAHSRLPHR